MDSKNIDWTNIISLVAIFGIIPLVVASWAATSTYAPGPSKLYTLVNGKSIRCSDSRIITNHRIVTSLHLTNCTDRKIYTIPIGMIKEVDNERANNTNKH